MIAPPPLNSIDVKAPIEPASRETLLASGAHIPLAKALNVPTFA